MNILYFFNPNANARRFYSIEVTVDLFGEVLLVRRWGRIGCSGSVKADWFATPEAALKIMRQILKTKIRRGYEPPALLSSASVGSAATI